MIIVKYKKIFISIAVSLVALSIFSMFFFGLNMGIDFRGGALTEVVYNGDRPEMETLSGPLAELGLGNILLQPTVKSTGELGYIVKSADLDDSEHTKILDVLAGGDRSILTETSFNSIGPSVGRELARKALVAIVLVSLAIICFIAFAFRKVSKPVSSWRYGLIAVVTLLHDVVIPTGIFAIMSHFSGVELNTLFVVAILTILGLSVSDTIVIFDRIRENLKENRNNKKRFPEVVGQSLEQSYVRSINTSLSTILVLLALFFFGPASTSYFALILIVGMFFGTYSSIFLASPLLVLLEEWQHK